MSNLTIINKTVPEYTIQHNAISRSIYKLTPYARKLIAMAMACMTMQGDDNYTVEFSAADFATAFGLNLNDLGAKQKDILLKAVSECADSSIKINMPDGTWEAYPWFIHSALPKFNNVSWSWNTATIKMTFNHKLSDVIASFQQAYSKITLVDLGRLQSSYAIRYYEIAMSYKGLAGTGSHTVDRVADSIVLQHVLVGVLYHVSLSMGHSISVSRVLR
jgi:plasmid replication initiation protein